MNNRARDLPMDLIFSVRLLNHGSGYDTSNMEIDYQFRGNRDIPNFFHLSSPRVSRFTSAVTSDRLEGMAYCCKVTICVTVASCTYGM